MKLSQIREYWPIFEAAKAGKTIQRFDNGGWWDCDPNQSCVSFRHAPEKYRIKPEPKLRPWKPEEGVGKVCRNKADGHVAVVLGWHKDSNQFVVPTTGGNCELRSPEYLLAFSEQLDGKPCGVEE